MVSDLSFDELHKFAERIGVKRHWFHKNHYDIREEEWHRAIEAGASLVEQKILVRKMIK